MKIEKTFEYIGVTVVAVAILTAVSLVFAWPMKWLVNYLFSEKALEAVFGMSQIGYWKAFWLNFFLASFYGRSSNKS